ncbi:MAG: DUF389 domain-containing protein [Rickettsiales bacterium]|jgi:uncharacterized membrane protein|nr:DUF389 domain-containing protein [Rickettsiales bacterium]
MSYRIIETIISQEFNEKLEKFREKPEIVTSWTIPVYENNKIKYSFIVENNATELIVDSLSKLLKISREINNKEDLEYIITISNVDSMVPQITKKNENNVHKFRIVDRVSVNEISENLKSGMDVHLNFFLNTICALIVACISIVMSDKSILVAAATISPAFGPLANYAFLLATCDASKIKNVLKAIFINIVLSILSAYIFGNFLYFTNRYGYYLSNIRVFTEEAQLSVYTFLLASISGFSAGLAITSGISTLMSSFMLSISLVPVYTLIGLNLSVGYYDKVDDLLLLLFSNILFIILSGFFVFYIKKIRPRTRAAIITKKWLYPVNLAILCLFIYLFIKVKYGI